MTSPDFAILPHYQVPLAYEAGAYVYTHGETSITVVEAAHGYQLRMATTTEDGTIAIVVEGVTLAKLEGALERMVNKATQIAADALTCASIGARYCTDAVRKVA